MLSKDRADLQQQKNLSVLPDRPMWNTKGIKVNRTQVKQEQKSAGMRYKRFDDAGRVNETISKVNCSTD